MVKDKKEMDGQERDCYIVIDGQQRLTTIFILYRFLTKASNFHSLQNLKKKLNKDLYRIFYETRKMGFQYWKRYLLHSFKERAFMILIWLMFQMH